ncbi:MAG: nucleotide exchange factor GrpE [Candidatus Saccharibacteria bacterium]
MTDKIKSKKSGIEQQIAELTTDLQRTRADFENYMKRAEIEKTTARESGQIVTILKLLPVIDNIERAIAYLPAELAENKWAQSVAGLVKNLEKSLGDMGVQRIESQPGTAFNPDLHDAIQVDEEAVGDHEVVAEELQPGYTLNGTPIRHAMVKVTRN